MSRSEHATRRDPRDPGDLDRKRRIMALMADERIRPGTRPPALVADAVEIPRAPRRSRAACSSPSPTIAKLYRLATLRAIQAEAARRLGLALAPGSSLAVFADRLRRAGERAWAARLGRAGARRGRPATT